MYAIHHMPQIKIKLRKILKETHINRTPVKCKDQKLNHEDMIDLK